MHDYSDLFKETFTVILLWSVAGICAIMLMMNMMVRHFKIDCFICVFIFLLFSQFFETGQNQFAGNSSLVICNDLGVRVDF